MNTLQMTTLKNIYTNQLDMEIVVKICIPDTINWESKERVKKKRKMDNIKNMLPWDIVLWAKDLIDNSKEDDDSWEESNGSM